MIIPAAQARSLMRATFSRARVFCRDGEYTPLNLTKLARLHEEHLDFLAAMFGIPRAEVRWVQDLYDCDKFSASLDSYANIRFAKKFFVTGIRRPALCLGTLSYNIGGKRGAGHMVNVGITEDREVFVLEPQQTRTIIKTLTDAEKTSAWAIAL
jgi:hypothetical protein